MIKYGMVGTGMMAHAHIDGLSANGTNNVSFIAVCGRNKEKCDAFASQYGLKAYYDFDQMLKDDNIDAIDVCTPSFTHEQYAVSAAKARKHVLIEKPVAFTIEAAQNIYNAAEENNVKIMVAQLLRFWPEYVKIKELVDNGILGDIITIYAARLGQAPTWADWYKYPEKSGETLMNLTLHDIDYVHYLLGKAKSIYSAGAKDRYDSYNDVMNIIKFESGANVLIDGSLTMTPGYPFSMHMRVLGSKATVEFSYKAGENLDADSCKTSLILYLPEESGGKEIDYKKYDAYGLEVQYFADCIQDGAEIDVVTKDSVLDVLRSILKAKESLVTGKVYEL